MEIAGRCHCGNLSFVLHSDREADELRARECDCTFCRAHGAKCVADADGRAVIRVDDASQLLRYRFGMQTADFLVCRACGVYLGAVIDVDNATFSTLNIRTSALRDVPASAQSYAGETREERIARRRHTWTPTEIRVSPGSR